MRIVSSHCRMFEYRVTTPSPCAVELAPSEIGVARPFFDCLLLTVGVQPGDLTLTGAAADIVEHLAARTHSAHLVIDGFAQWAATAERFGPAADFDVLTGLADALDVLADLAQRLEERGERVHLMPFGWNRIQHAEVSEGRWARHVTDVRDDTRRTRKPQPWTLAPRTRIPCAHSHR
ncbi:hypothetical protein [Nocardia wallacei]|uniref:hypothetical protein n=1 Tax=Nocardia wallacei TaxID=480035 RepID=UPI002458B977|nr:hypothetical protein [Nocardia wallacei]